MLLPWIVMGVAVATVLAILWFRNRHTTDAPTKLSESPDRGIIGEAATAYEDVARQLLNEGRNKSDNDGL